MGGVTAACPAHLRPGCCHHHQIEQHRGPAERLELQGALKPSAPGQGQCTHSPIQPSPEHLQEQGIPSCSGQQCQGLVAFTGKDFSPTSNQNRPSFSLKPLPPTLSPRSLIKSLSSTYSWAPTIPPSPSQLCSCTSPLRHNKEGTAPRGERLRPTAAPRPPSERTEGPAGGRTARGYAAPSAPTPCPGPPPASGGSAGSEARRSRKDPRGQRRVRATAEPRTHLHPLRPAARHRLLTSSPRAGSKADWWRAGGGRGNACTVTPPRALAPPVGGLRSGGRTDLSHWDSENFHRNVAFSDRLCCAVENHQSQEDVWAAVSLFPIPNLNLGVMPSV